MKNFFSQHFLNEFPLTPPVKAEQKLSILFSNAVNIQWYKQNENYAVLFTFKNRDCMAVFSKTYEIILYKMLVPINNVPIHILNAISDIGSITNAVLIDKIGVSEYELICSTPNLKQVCVILNSSGTIIMKTNL